MKIILKMVDKMDNLQERGLKLQIYEKSGKVRDDAGKYKQKAVKIRDNMRKTVKNEGFCLK